MKVRIEEVLPGMHLDLGVFQGLGLTYLDNGEVDRRTWRIFLRGGDSYIETRHVAVEVHFKKEGQV